MKRSMLYLSLLLLLHGTVAAVDDTTGWAASSYPLEQILAIAESNASELKVIETKMQAGRAEVDIYRSEAMPYVSFGSGASLVSQSQATQKLQQTMMFALFDRSSGSPGGSASSPSQSPTSGTSINYPDRINGYAYNWSLNVKQPLITFGKVRSALKLARMRECTLKDTRRLQRDMFFLRVIQEFAEAYSAQIEVGNAEEALKRSLQLQTRLASEFEAGRTIRREVLRIDALVKGDRANLFAARGKAETTYRRLMHTINSDDSTMVPLEIDPFGPQSAMPPASGPGSTQLFLKKNEAALYKQQSKYIRSAFFPTLDLVGSIGNQFMTIDTNGLVGNFISEETSAAEAAYIGQMFDANNPKADKYFDPDFFNYSIGVQLTWTLFDGNRTRAQYRQAKLKSQQALLEYDIMEEQKETEIREARNQIITVDSTLSSVELQKEAALLALQQTEEDYKDGLTDFNTLLDVEKEAREASRMHYSLQIQRVLALAQLKIIMGIPVYGDEK